MKVKLWQLLSFVASAIGGIGLLSHALATWATAPPQLPKAPRLTELPVADQQQIARVIELIALARTVEQDQERNLDPLQLQIAWSARRQLMRPDFAFRDDCSGFVSAVYTEVGVPMNGVVAQLWDLAVDYDALHWEDVPQVGDLVFFDNSWDRNHNRLLDDELTHIGIVIDVEPDGTFVYAQAGVSSGRGTARMNLLQPDVNEDARGITLNNYLRAPQPGDPADTPYLTGELFRGFATIDPDLDWSTNLPWIPLD